MERIVTIRLLDQFEPRIDILRRTSYGADPIKVTMADEFDGESSLHLVAFCEGEAVGSVRLTRGECTPLKKWTDSPAVEQGAHVVDFNRAVVSSEFRRAGLCRLLLSEALLVAKRLGFAHAVAGIDGDSHLYGMFAQVGFARVGSLTKCRHGLFESYVQAMETPVVVAQAKAHGQFGRALDSMRQAGYLVRSLVPTDVETIQKRWRVVRPAGATENSAQADLGRAAQALAELPLAPAVKHSPVLPPLLDEPERWRETPLAARMFERLAAIVVITPIFAAVERWVVEMEASTVWFVRVVTALLILIGLGDVLMRLGRKWLGRSKRPSLSTELVIALALLSFGSLVLYALGGASLRAMALGTACAIVTGLMCSPLVALALQWVRSWTFALAADPQSSNARTTPIRRSSHALEGATLRG